MKNLETITLKASSGEIAASSELQEQIRRRAYELYEQRRWRRGTRTRRLAASGSGGNPIDGRDKGRLNAIPIFASPKLEQGDKQICLSENSVLSRKEQGHAQC